MSAVSRSVVYVRLWDICCILNSLKETRIYYFKCASHQYNRTSDCRLLINLQSEIRRYGNYIFHYSGDVVFIRHSAFVLQEEY